MPSSPIQVVLHSDNFLAARDPVSGGQNKEFYENDPSGFSVHKAKVIESLKGLSTDLKKNEFSALGYAKVVLKRSGWAKSHRPTRALFKPEVAPVVGAGDIGELYVEINTRSIERIISKVEKVETELSYKTIQKNGEDARVPDPSRERSEVGAIATIEPYLGDDKRSFSTEIGLKWLKNARTGGYYIIELFEIPPPKSDWDAFPKEKVKLFRTFTEGLEGLGKGVVAKRITDTAGSYPMVGLRLDKSSSNPEVQFLPHASRKPAESEFDDSIDRHRILISFLDKHPLVKKIHLPPIIKRTSSKSRSRPDSAKILAPTNGKIYPRIAVVDGGISKVLNGWIIDRWRLLAPSHRSEDHGTFIAGLAVAGEQLNGPAICGEPDGCHLIDIDILPDEQVRFSEYFNSPTDFLDELATAVQTMKARTGVRIFNFSMNVEQAVESDTYNPFSRRLDQIATENDVIFIISAGNVPNNYHRSEWPLNAVQALASLANSTNDRLRVPAESVRNLSVGAVNPPNVLPALEHAPAIYSCRGPGLRIGLKPDLAHIGGSGTLHPRLGHGLFSITPDGNVSDGCGTSYATPLVAKTVAMLDTEIEGDVSRETLMALVSHHAVLPEYLADKDLRHIARHLVGFGIPKSSTEILQGDDHQITLVFANRLKEGKRMKFSFAWPRSLVRNGKCLGYAKLTLVSTPPLDYRYGAEFVRVNMDASLRQEQSNGHFRSKLEPIYLPSTHSGAYAEADLIEHGLKWSPVKAYAKTFPKGVGKSTNWHLDVEYIARDGEELPSNGVPFTVLLTIGDPKKDAPVFNDVRQMLQSVGIETADIRTAARVVARV